VDQTPDPDKTRRCTPAHEYTHEQRREAEPGQVQPQHSCHFDVFPELEPRPPSPSVRFDAELAYCSILWQALRGVCGVNARRVTVGQVIPGERSVMGSISGMALGDMGADGASAQWPFEPAAHDQRDSLGSPHGPRRCTNVTGWPVSASAS
jgi:hypothetical protein